MIIPPAPKASSEAIRTSMKGNKRANTKPEVRLRSLLHRRGLRFRKDFRVQHAAGSVKPDIVFTRRKVAIFVDGCYWHLCPEHGHMPKTNFDYWYAKLTRNVERDEANNRALAQAGWSVLRIWEHEETEEATDRVVELLHNQRDAL